jgi:hypothetical protein
MITVHMSTWEEMEELLADDAYDFKMSDAQLARFEADLEAFKKVDVLGSSVLFYHPDPRTGLPDPNRSVIVKSE